MKWTWVSALKMYVLQLLQPQNSIKSSQADSHIKMWKFSVSGTDSVPIFRVPLITWCPAIQYTYFCLVWIWDGVSANQWVESGYQWTWPTLSIKGSADCFSILIVSYHVRLNMKPASLLKLLGCNCISIASPTIPVGGCPGQSTFFFLTEFHILCFVGVLLQQIFLTGHDIGVLYVPYIWFHQQHGDRVIPWNTGKLS